MPTARELNKRFTDSALQSAGISDPSMHQAYAALRLEEGATEYGENQFFKSMCDREGAEEFIDGANWLGFEFVKRYAARDIGPDVQLLHDAAAHAAIAYDLARQYIEGRAEAAE